MRLAYAPYMLKFRHPAGTSRGILTEKPTYIIKVWDEANPMLYGIGEASVFPGLSTEADGRYEYKIVELLANVALGRATDLRRYPSLQLGFEQAIRDFVSGGEGKYFDSPFIKGQQEITINGLIWIGSLDEMMTRLQEKVEAGFSCIKIKIGALDWQKEKALLQEVRTTFSEKKLMLRVDANGGFTKDNVMNRLETLASLGVHSIEQPLHASEVEATASLCRVTPVPIALDEQLIGLFTTEEKEKMLDEIMPQYIILKPSLCGAFSGTEEWMTLADERGIGYWITSALESNIGLNAIAQFAASKIAEGRLAGPQGLGTGGLYTNNFLSPLNLEGENLKYDTDSFICRACEYDNLPWRE